MNTTLSGCKYLMRRFLIAKVLGIVCLLAVSTCSFWEDKFPEKTYVVITFDDQHSTIYETAYPLMEAYGFSGVNVINTGEIGKTDKLTWQQVEELEFMRGWETAGHTLNHANLPECTFEEAFYQIEQDWLNLKQRGLSHETFVLPRGHATYRDYEIIIQFYDNIRNSQDLRMYYPIDRRNIGYFAYLTSYTAEDVFLRITEGILNKEALIVIGFHRFDDENHTHSCSREDFEKILKFIKEQGLEVITIKEAARMLS